MDTNQPLLVPGACALAQRFGVQTALHWAGFGAIASVGLALAFRLPDTTVDLSPGIHGRLPAIFGDIVAQDRAGPVLVTVNTQSRRSISSNLKR